MKRKTQNRIAVIIIFSALSLFLSVTIVYELIIPDICYYHFNEMNPTLELFYDVKGGANGYPSPSFLNLFFSALIGGFSGNLVYSLIINKKNKEDNHNQKHWE